MLTYKTFLLGVHAFPRDFFLRPEHSRGELQLPELQLVLVNPASIASVRSIVSPGKSDVFPIGLIAIRLVEHDTWLTPSSLEAFSEALALEKMFLPFGLNQNKEAAIPGSVVRVQQKKEKSGWRFWGTA